MVVSYHNSCRPLSQWVRKDPHLCVVVETMKYIIPTKQVS
jgi:hypothetical protein